MAIYQAAFYGPCMRKQSNRQAKPTTEDIKAAQRLAAIWDSTPRTKRPTQQEIADRWGEGATQALISQYLRGRIPLNYYAVIRFAEELGCDPADIRDDLPEMASHRVLKTRFNGVREVSEYGWPFNFDRARYERRSDDEKKQIEGAVLHLIIEFERHSTPKKNGLR